MTEFYSREISLRREWRQIWRRKYWVFGTTMAGLLLGILFSSPWFMPPEYRSTAELLPPSIANLRSLDFTSEDEDYIGFGSAKDKDLEQLTSILTADTVMYHMTKRFDLLEAYGLADLEDRHRRDKLLRDYYNEQVNVGLTRNSTVEVEVYNTDPQKSHAIASAYVAYADSVLDQIPNRRKELAQMRQSMQEADSLAASIQDSLEVYRTRDGIYDIKEMPEVLAQKLKSKFRDKSFNENYDHLISNQILLGAITGYRENLRQKIEVLKMNLAVHPSTLLVTETPSVNYDKARPVRSIIVLLSGLGALLVAVVSVLLFDRKPGGDDEPAAARS